MNLKLLAERFRVFAEDKAGIRDLAENEIAANKGDDECHALCNRFKNAQNASEVHDIADEIKNKTV